MASVASSSASTTPTATTDLPAVLLSPTRKRKKRKTNSDAIYSKSDQDAWNHSDAEIIGGYSKLVQRRGIPDTNYWACSIAASQSRWSSDIYDHYNITLERKNNTLIFVFTCNVDPTRHTPHKRARVKTSTGTHDLWIGKKQCDARRGVVEVPTD